MSLTKGRGTAASAAAGAQMIAASGATSSGRRSEVSVTSSACGRTLGQGLAPDGEASAFEQEFADFGGLFEAAGQNLDELAQRRRMVDAVTERIRR